MRYMRYMRYKVINEVVDKELKDILIQAVVKNGFDSGICYVHYCGCMYAVDIDKNKVVYYVELM